MSGEKRYPWIVAEGVAEDIVEQLRPFCKRIEIAGSLRRKKPDVGDIEILYIPLTIVRPDQEDLFKLITVDMAAVRITGFLSEGVLDVRLNSKGSKVYGPLNKLTIHVDSGIPVDLFTANEENWFNQLVCRTGPKELNQDICNAAIRKGWHWMPYGRGFSRGEEVHAINSEREVFDFVGLPYAEPWERR